MAPKKDVGVSDVSLEPAYETVRRASTEQYQHMVGTISVETGEYKKGGSRTFL